MHGTRAAQGGQAKARPPCHYSFLRSIVSLLPAAPLAASPLGEVVPAAAPEALGSVVAPAAEGLLSGGVVEVVGGSVVELVGGGVVVEPVPDDELEAPGPVLRGLSSPQPANAAATADATATFANKRNVSFMDAPFENEPTEAAATPGVMQAAPPIADCVAIGVPGGFSGAEAGFVKNAG